MWSGYWYIVSEASELVVGGDEGTVRGVCVCVCVCVCNTTEFAISI